MPFLAPIGGAIASGLGAVSPDTLFTSLLGGVGGALQSSGPQMEPFRGGSNAQQMMDELLRTWREAFQREQYLANQPRIAFGLPGVSALSEQQYNIPGLDMSLGFSPAVTEMFAQPRLISHGLDAAYWNQALPPSQRKSSGDEPWRQVADSILTNIAYSPLQQASAMAPPIMPAPVGPARNNNGEEPTIPEREIRRRGGMY